MARPVFYLKLVDGHRGALDRVGGRPSHVPPYFPKSSVTGDEKAFLLQLYSEPVRLPLQGWLCIQVYKPADLADPDCVPEVVMVPSDAPRNTESLGVAHPDVRPMDIEWEEGLEPDVIPDDLGNSPGELRLFSSKLGGAAFDETTRHIGFIEEGEEGFVFGGLLVLFLDAHGRIRARVE